MLWQIEDGATVRIWKDNWVRDEKDQDLNTVCPDGLDNLKFKKLIDIGQVNEKSPQ